MTPETSGLTGRQRLVSAATELFVRDGYRATSMKSIATRAGVSTPALYWHFSSKQELYLTSMECVLDDFVSHVAARVKAFDPTERLREFVDAHVTWRLEEREAAGAFTAAIGSRDVLSSLPEAHRRSLAAKQRDYLDQLSSILTAGRVAGVFRDDSRVTAFAIVTMCDYVSTWYDPAGMMAPDRVAQLYGDCILRMLDASFVSAGHADTHVEPSSGAD